MDASKFSVTVTSSSGSSETVEKFDTVNVHYHGTLLNGDVFDSSYDRGQPLKFKVGAGRVIKCWDQGLVGLNVGDKANLVCPPDYAYGNRDMGKIKPNMPLLFAVEVVSIAQKHKPTEPPKEEKKTE